MNDPSAIDIGIGTQLPSTSVQLVAASAVVADLPGTTFATRLGLRLERVVVAIINGGVDADDPFAVRAIVKECLAAPPALRGRRALNLASSMATVYARRFAPPAPWRLVGSNVRIGTGRADLLFTDGRHWLVDELKAGRMSPTDPLLATQVSRYQNASGQYGDRFLGVRVALLRAPARLVAFPAAAACRPLPAARSR